MMTEIPAKKKHWWSTDSSADEHHEDHPEVKTVKREVKHLRRITKRGEMALGHMSEALEREKVGEKELDITRAVMEGISETPVPAPAPVKPAAPRDTTFVCYECGAKIPRDSIRCPSCDILYVLDPKDEAIDVYLTLKDETVSDGTDTRVFSEGSMAFAHFDLKIGEVTCLRTEQGDTDFGLECHNCGALTQFGTDMCPLCGHSFDEWDTGLVGLMEGLKFDLDDDKELNCPRCGEHIVVNEGKCPACKELITFRSKNSPDAVVLPIIKEKDVVFVHLDVLNDDLSFARKVKFRKTNDSQTVHLESVSKSGFDHDWKSLSRI